MRIAIDARWIFDEISGVGLYTQELIRHLAAIDHDNEYILLFDKPRLMRRAAEITGYHTTTNFEEHLVNQSVFSPTGQIAIPRTLRQLAPDVYHSPNYMIPLLSFPGHRRGHIKCVVTIHDVIPLAFPDSAPRSLKRRFFPVYRQLMQEIGRRAHAILTVSEASKADVIKHLRIPSGRHDYIVVVYNGVSETFIPPLRDSDPRPPTILYVGRVDPYKNLVALVEAFARVRRARVPNAILRIVGSLDARYPEAPHRARELGVEDSVQWIGYAEKDRLLHAYQNSDVYVHPSRYEGFGLTVLEAMACGTPVVCSNRSSLPEVTGNAAIHIDPDNIEQMADAISNVLTDPSLAKQLREKGLARAQTFTWTRSAGETLALYNRLADEKK